MTIKKSATLVAAVLLICLLATGIGRAYQTQVVDWWVIGGGGDYDESASFAVGGTIGQALVGTTSREGYDLCAGFWCATEAAQDVYLPVVLRQH